MHDDIADLTLTDVADAIRAKRLSSEEATHVALDRIEAAQPVLNAFIAIDAEGALDAARAADAALARGEVYGPLHGVPLAHKDMFYRAGHVSTCGSTIRRDFVPDVTATVLDRLDAAGAIQVGTLNMSEFASSPTGHNVHTGHPRNPWNPDHITGGSSSGSGGATAARLVWGALGSDTGGSVRLPATMCGITGLKPTYGRVSRFGCMPLSWSMDHIGPLARSARDCARMMAVIAGYDPKDTTSSPRPVPDYEDALNGDLRGLRVGVPTNYFGDGLDDDVRAATDASLGVLLDLGAEAVPIHVPYLDDCTSIGNVLTRVEAASIHRRWLKTRPDDYGQIVRYRLEIGLSLPGTRYVEALNMRGPITDAFVRAVFDKVDVIHTPGMKIGVPTIAESEPTPENTAWVANALTSCTRAFNYLGLPAISAPCGFDRRGLPVAMQLVGRPFAERRLLTIAHRYQLATDWHARVPPVPRSS